MSRWFDRLRQGRQDAGFTLVEIMVALTLVALAAGGSIPLLVIAAKAAGTSRLNTQAKNLAQWRFESMRDLPFHVDRQNGPFVDLLDIYYTNLGTTPVTRTRANEIEVGHWVASGSAPDPSGPFYQIQVASLPGYPSFSQTIDTQFLSVTGASVPATTFPGYDSQTEGHDSAPSTLVGVTVITTWTDHGNTHSYTSYTRIADSRGLQSTLTSQGSAEYLQVSSAGPSGNALTVDLASADATGGQSTGSIAAADVRTLVARDALGQQYLGASAVSTSPTGASSATGPLPSFSTGTNGGDCGWVGAGQSQVSDATASTTGGLPQVPTDIDNASPPANQAAAQVTTGGNSPCGIFGFANQSNGYSSNLMLDSATPLVRINNDTGNTVALSGSAWVNASVNTANPHTVTSGANTGSNDLIRLFPGASFTNGAGLVRVKLSQASIACQSSVTGGVATPSATASWTATISYWKATDTSGNGALVTLPTYTWTSASNSGSADPLAAINPSSVVVYQNGSTVLHLSDYIASWSTARSIVENVNSGVHQLDSIVSIATAPVRDGDALSSVGLQVGNLSCVADDSR